MAFRIASLAILTALTAVFTYMVRIPIARTGGYLNLGDVIIYFTAFTFGPVSALVAGGLGTAIPNGPRYPFWPMVCRAWWLA